MRFDPQCGYTTESDTASQASAAGEPQAGGSPIGRAVASIAVVLTALLGVWIWQQQSPAVSRAEAAPSESPGKPDAQTAELPGVESDKTSARNALLKDAHAGARNSLHENAPPKSTTVGAVFEIDYSDGSQHGRSEILLQQGKELLAIGHTRRAIQLLDESVRLNPASAEARYNLGLAYVLRRDMDAAREQRDVLHELDANLANLLGNLVR